MARLTLSLAMSGYDRVQPMLAGEVRPAGIELDYQGMPGGIAGVLYTR